MKEELNITDILREKPTGIKLYSCIYGNVTFKDIMLDDVIRVYHHDTTSFVRCNGKVNNDGEVILYPSFNMRDWSKFAWKKGDVLRFSDILVIFEEWAKDDYTEFKAVYEFNCTSKSFNKGNNYHTSEFCKTIDETANNFIKKIEDYYGGKLNLKTLEIEKTKPEFKDGDIVHCPAGDIMDEMIFIAKVGTKGVLHSYVYMSKDDMISFVDSSFSVSGCLGALRLATDSEKQQLFDALAKENKAWDSEKKAIVDLPKKCEFETFQKVLVRDDLDNYWRPAFFYKSDSDKDYPYTMVGGEVYSECIPYNDKTAHLLGTTDEWKGGEG